jgi:hypothetical protein
MFVFHDLHSTVAVYISHNLGTGERQARESSYVAFSQSKEIGVRIHYCGGVERQRE